MSDTLSEDYFYQMCLQAGVAIAATDTHLKIRFCNPLATQLFGRSADELLGKPITAIIPPDRIKLANQVFEQTLQQGQAGEFDFNHRDPLGNPILLAVLVAPVSDESGQRIGVSVIFRDVTHRIKSERASAEVQKMSALGTMAGAVAHHFNNLLAGLMTTADFSQNSNDPHLLRRALQSITSTLTRASKLTHALLAFAEGAHYNSPAEDVTATVQKFIAKLEPSLFESEITLQTDVQPIGRYLPAMQVRAILECLTSNALEAMPAGGTLSIELMQTPDSQDLVLRIADSGQGIAENELSRVFEPFFTTKSQGMVGLADHPGLGLAMVHGIVRSLGGTVTLCSSPTSGTICSIQVPYCD